MTDFFNLNDKHTNALKNLLNDSLTKGNEFEIRFGRFYQDKEQKHMNFDSNIEIENFYKLKKGLKQIEHFHVNTREYIYKTKMGNVKKIINLNDNSETILVKTVVRNYDIYDYDLRLSSSYEKIDNSLLEDLSKENYELVRNKSRTTYKFPFGKMDLTIVEQEFQNGKTQLKHEVEFEVENFDLNNILGLITFVLQTRQDSFYVISNMERRYILSEYKNLISANYFIGAQPETLHKEKISMLYKNYSVTDKADGERAFMIIDKHGNIYYMDNNLNKVIKTNLKSKSYVNTLVDGEIIKQNDKIIFLAFDLIFYNGKDLRGDMDYKLKTRLDKLNDILLSIESNKYYKLKLKKYYYNNVFLGSKIILDNIDSQGNYKITVGNLDVIYKNDGLIYTPMDEPYPKTKKWHQLLKWKPAELNTIDFYSKKISSENGISKWQLFVQNPIEKKNNVKGNITETVLFDIVKLCHVESSEQLVTYETVFSDDLIDETTGESYQSNTVIEYKWDKYNKLFVPLRTRWDKTINPKKHGNFSDVACDIWNNINNPIEKELLFKFRNISSNGDFFFERMRRFHNKIKEYLYNKYCKDTENLLELCSGRGGDIHKWIYNNIKNVTGYDISEKNITECNRRISSLNVKPQPNYNFYKLDLTNDNSYEIVYKGPDNLFNTVCCHFGIHYFFESQKSVENIIKILDTSLLKGGYFIITFMDNKQIDQLFNKYKNNNMCYLEKDGEIVYLLERDNRFNVYGNKLKITLNGNNILNEGSEEWIIDFEDFTKLMESKGYQCVETNLFENLFDNTFNLNECEKDISFLNRYCIFQKQDQSINLNKSNSIQLCNQSLDKINNITIQFKFDTIDLHQQNVSVHKIANLYDMIDVINCIEYKYYKNKIQNKETNLNPDITFNDIQNAFKQLNITYNPVFIMDPLNFKEYKPNDNNIYFTYYKYTVEKKNIETENNLDDIEYNNWYIILYKDKILFKTPIIKDNENEIKITKDNENEIINTTKLNTMDDEIIKEMNNLEIKDIVKKQWEDVQKNGEKITIKLLKDLLLKLDLKTVGKKEDLQKRLEERLNNCLF